MQKNRIQWTEKDITFCTVGMALLYLLLNVVVNFSVNDFGLWRHRDQARIWGLEKTSKHLLSYRYIPENFDSILIGSSVSDNINPTYISSLNLYNMSMAGGNITEVGTAAKIFLQRSNSPKVLLVSLHPYMLSSTGTKSFQISNKEYFGSLFSTISWLVWFEKLKINILKKPDSFSQSYNGYQDITKNTIRKDIEEQLKVTKEDCLNSPATKLLDPSAVKELRSLLNLARAKGVKIIGFYQPFLAEQWKIWQACGKAENLHKVLDSLFEKRETVIDFNTTKYDYLNKRRDLRIDLTHFNQEGATLFSKALNERIEKELR